MQNSYAVLTVLMAAVVFSGCSDSSDDSSNNAGSVSAETSEDNRVPIIGSFSTDSSTVETGATAVFNWSVSDPDSDTLTCQLDADGDGSAEYTIQNCESVASQEHVFDVPGVVNALLTVSDDSATTAQSTLQVEVTGEAVQAPVVSRLDVSSSRVERGTSVTFSWVVSDPGGQAVNCALDTDNDGTAEYQIEDCSATTRQDHVYPQSGEFVAQLSATNATGETRTRTASVSVTELGGGPDSANPPIITEFEADPDTIMIREPVTFSWLVSDLDSDTLTCSIDYDGNGTEDFQTQSCMSVTSQQHIYALPGSYEAILTATDELGSASTRTTPVTVLPIQFKIAADDSVEAGGRYRFLITLSNVSLVPVNNVRVLYRLPDGLSFDHSTDVVPDLRGCFSCNEGDEATWQFPSLAAGESQSIEINARVGEGVASGTTISSTVSIAAEGVSDSIIRRKVVSVDNRPLTVLKLSGMSDALQAGDITELVVDVGNLSNDAVESLEVRLQLPENSAVIGISDGGTQDAQSGEIVWSIANLPVLQSARRDVMLSVARDLVPGEILVSRATLQHIGGQDVDSTAENTISISERRSPLQLEIDARNDPVAAGGRGPFAFTVSNVSLVPLTDVFVTFRVPAGMTLDHSTDSRPDLRGCFTCGPHAEAGWALGSLSAGQSRTIEINPQVSPDLQGGNLITGSLTVSASNVLDRLNLTKSIRVDNRPRSVVAISSMSDALQAGESLAVDIDFGNLSTAALDNAALVLEVPASATVSDISEGGTRDGVSGDVSWVVGTVPVLQSGSRQLTVTMPGDAAAGDIQPLRAVLQHDGGPEFDAAAEYRVTVLETNPPIELSLLAEPASVAPGGRLRYTITVENTSFVPLNNLAIVYRLPEGISFDHNDDAEPDARGCFSCRSASEATWTFTGIASGETRTIDVNTQVAGDVQAGSLILSPFTAVADNLSNDVTLLDVVPVE